MGSGSMVTLFLAEQSIREPAEVDRRREKGYLPKAGSYLTAQIRRSYVSVMKCMVNDNYG